MWIHIPCDSEAKCEYEMMILSEFREGKSYFFLKYLLGTWMVDQSQTHSCFCQFIWRICDNSYEVKSVMTCSDFTIIKLYWELFAYWNCGHKIVNLDQTCQCFSNIPFPFIFCCINLNFREFAIIPALGEDWGTTTFFSLWFSLCCK